MQHDEADRFGDVECFYEEYYDRALRSGCIGAAQKRTHQALEKTWTAKDRFNVVLEVGAGSGGHRPFVKHAYETYYETDLRVPDPVDLPLTDGDGGRAVRLVRRAEDAEALSFEADSVDRLIATCLLLHLPDPEGAMREWRRVVKPDGVLSILVPCEPGLLLRTSRSLLTAPKVRSLGFEGYSLFNARDHRNHVGGLDEMVRYTFRRDSVRTQRYPFPWRSWNLNVYFVYQIRRLSAHA